MSGEVQWNGTYRAKPDRADKVLPTPTDDAEQDGTDRNVQFRSEMSLEDVWTVPARAPSPMELLDKRLESLDLQLVAHDASMDRMEAAAELESAPTADQQAILDCVDDLYEAWHGGLITDEDLLGRYEELATQLQATTDNAGELGGVVGAHPPTLSEPRNGDHHGTVDAAVSEHANETHDDIGQPEDAGPAAADGQHGAMPRISARLWLPTQLESNELFAQFDDKHAEQLSLSALRRLVRDLWGSELSGLTGAAWAEEVHLPRLVELASKSVGKVGRRQLRDVLKCVIYLSERGDAVLDLGRMLSAGGVEPLVASSLSGGGEEDDSGDATRAGQLGYRSGRVSDRALMNLEDFRAGCAAVEERLSDGQAEAEYVTLRGSKRGSIQFCEFCLWLARRNVLDEHVPGSSSAAFSGVMVIPAMPDSEAEQEQDDADRSGAELVVDEATLREMSERGELQSTDEIVQLTYLPQSAGSDDVPDTTAAADGEAAGLQEEQAGQWDPGNVIQPEASVETDIPQLRLGGAGTQRVPNLLPPRYPQYMGTEHDHANADEGGDWRGDREAGREMALRRRVARLGQAKGDRARESELPPVAGNLGARQSGTDGATQLGVGSGDEGDEESTIVDVEPVVLGATTYLVDKVNGVVYANLLRDGEPVIVGRWEAEKGAEVVQEESGAVQAAVDRSRETAAVNQWEAAHHGQPAAPVLPAAGKGQASTAEEPAGAGRRVHFASRTQLVRIDAGAIPSVSFEAGHDGQQQEEGLMQPGEGEGSQEFTSPLERPLVLGVPMPGQAIPSLEHVHTEAKERRMEKVEHTLAYLASHTLDEWPEAAPPPQVRAGRPDSGVKSKVDAGGSRLSAATAPGMPSPRSPRHELPPDMAVPVRGLLSACSCT
jgi:hypothetical protein